MSEIKVQLPLALSAEMIIYIQSVAKYLMEHANGIPNFGKAWSYATLWEQLAHSVANPIKPPTWMPQAHQRRTQQVRADARRAQRESNRWGPYARAPRNTKRYAYSHEKVERFAPKIEELTQCFTAWSSIEFRWEDLPRRFAAMKPIELRKGTGVEVTARLFPILFPPTTTKPPGNDMASASSEVSEDHDTTNSSEADMSSSVGSLSEASTASSVTEDVEKEEKMEALGDNKPLTPSEVSEEMIAVTPPASDIGSSPIPAMEAQMPSSVTEEGMKEMEMETVGDNMAPHNEVQMPPCIPQEAEQVEEMDTSGADMPSAIEEQVVPIVPQVEEMEVEIETPGDNKPTMPDNMEGVEKTIVTCPDCPMGGTEEEKGDDDMGGTEETASTQPEVPRPQVAEPEPEQEDAAMTDTEPEPRMVVVSKGQKGPPVPILELPILDTTKSDEGKLIALLEEGSKRLGNIYSTPEPPKDAAFKPHNDAAFRSLNDVAFLFVREIKQEHHPIVRDFLVNRTWPAVFTIVDPVKLAHYHLGLIFQDPNPQPLEELVYSLMETRMLIGISRFHVCQARKDLMSKLLHLLARFNFTVFRKKNAPRPMRWEEMLTCVQEADTKAWNTARVQEFMYKLHMEGEMKKWMGDAVKKRCLEIAKREEADRFENMKDLRVTGEAADKIRSFFEQKGWDLYAKTHSDRDLKADVAVFGRRKHYLNGVMIYDDDEIFATGTGVGDGDRERRRRGKGR